MATSIPNNGQNAADKTSSNVILGELAAEIHIKIAEVLGKEELLALRQVCRALAKDTTDVFASRFFSKVVVRLNPGALQKFFEMTQIPEFARQMKHIHFTQPLGLGAVLRRDFITTEHRKEAAKLADSLSGSFRNLSLAGAGKSVEVEGTDSSHNLYVIGRALADSGHIFSGFECTILAYDKQNIAPFKLLSDHRKAVLREAFGKLKTLCVHIPRHFEFWKRANENIRSLLAGADQVTTLRLSLNTETTVGNLHRYFRLENLRELHLSEFAISQKEFWKLVLVPKSSLKKLVLTTCLLEPEPDVWPGVIGRIAEELRLISFAADDLMGRDEDYDELYLVDGEGNRDFEFEGTEDEVRTKLETLAREGNMEAEEFDDDEYSDFDDYDWENEERYDDDGY